MKRVLTGITTSGIPHLGNYAGALQPAIEASRKPGTDAFYFLADYHALVKCEDAQRVAQSRVQVAASWLAAGLDPERVTFYRQSDIVEIPELCWLLTCITPKGLMNRAHAYKAAVDDNIAKELEPDSGVNMGLFSYPVLMAADILIFKAQIVPVGRDQIQHLEMARDIALRFNHMYGQGKEVFIPPYEHVAEHVATLPGLDGRKMSKSYDNTIPLFEGTARDLKNAIQRIVTDSRAPGEPKDPDSAHLFTIYKAFATPGQSADFAAELRAGLGWGAAKDKLFELLNTHIAPMRERYHELMAQPQQIEDILLHGAEKARQITQPFMEEIRRAVGLIPAPQAFQQEQAVDDKQVKKQARWVSFKEEDSFYIRLLDPEGETIFLSQPFSSPKLMGQAMGALQKGAYELVAKEGHTALQVQEQVIALLDKEQLHKMQTFLK
ncbi:MAG TPA: tryptophan--tRNA ligase [Paenalcaligenes sp.]|nr:tryptophan--tRNA ligase [Paenalcaligenes sp.]